MKSIENKRRESVKKEEKEKEEEEDEKEKRWCRAEE